MRISTAASEDAVPAPIAGWDVRTSMAFDVVCGGELWIPGDPERLGVLFSLVFLDLYLLLLLLTTVFNGGHQVVQHFRVGDLGAGSFTLWRWTYG